MMACKVGGYSFQAWQRELPQELARGGNPVGAWRRHTRQQSHRLLMTVTIQQNPFRPAQSGRSS